MMEDRFLENDPAPLFLAGPFEEAEQSGLRKVVSSDAFRKAVLAFGAAATLFAVVWVVKAIVFASVTASEAGGRAPRDSGGQSPPAMQSNNGTASSNAQANSNAQAAPPPSDGLLAAFKAAVDNKADVDQPSAQPNIPPAAIPPSADALLNQFKAWATDEAAQAPAQQAEPPQTARAEAVQAARAEVVQPARADNVPLPKRRPTHVEQARAHDPPPPPPSLLRQLGWRN